MTNLLHMTFYTDGACSGNPGPGGWGVVALAYRGDQLIKCREISGGKPNTTNNRMELTAAIKALELLKVPSELDIVTDSMYVRNGIERWISVWKANGWRNSQKKQVKNLDLWHHLDDLASKHRVKWRWVKGHAGDLYNEKADELARAGLLHCRENSRSTASFG